MTLKLKTLFVSNLISYSAGMYVVRIARSRALNFLPQYSLHIEITWSKWFSRMFSIFFWEQGMTLAFLKPKSIPIYAISLGLSFWNTFCIIFRHFQQFLSFFNILQHFRLFSNFSHISNIYRFLMIFRHLQQFSTFSSSLDSLKFLIFFR